MLTEVTLFSTEDKVRDSIELLKLHEPPEGYYLAFSGGKDSCVMRHLCDVAGVKYNAHYNFTSVDPPELVKFIREYHSDVEIDRPQLSMFQLIIREGVPPTRRTRWCCRILKEHGGDGRVKLLGVRREESTRRKAYQQVCGDLISPILHWTELDVWEYIYSNNIPYCSLYDSDYSRLGCVMCPMKGTRGMIKDAERYPNFKKAYLSAFGKMIERRKEKGLPCRWKTAEEVMDWWISGKAEQEENLFDDRV